MLGPCGMAGADDFDALGAQIDQAMEDNNESEQMENTNTVISMCKKFGVPFDLKY